MPRKFKLWSKLFSSFNKIRDVSQGMTHHTFSACHNWTTFFKWIHMKALVMESVRMAQKRYTFELIAIAVLKDHIHLIIKTQKGEASISTIMQYIKARTTEKYNRVAGRSGTLWNGRFKNVVIEKEPNPVEYLLYLIWYVAYNPVRNGEEENPRTSYAPFINCYLQENFVFKSADITLHHMFMKLGDKHEERVRKFLYYEQLYLSKHPEIKIQ